MGEQSELNSYRLDCLAPSVSGRGVAESSKCIDMYIHFVHTRELK